MDKDVGTADGARYEAYTIGGGCILTRLAWGPGCPIKHPPIRAKITPPKRRPAAPPGPSTSPTPLIFQHFQNEGILEGRPGLLQARPDEARHEPVQDDIAGSLACP